MTVRLVDCRPREAYEAGHLPGAVHLDPETTSPRPPRSSVGGRHPLPDPHALGAVFARRRNRAGHLRARARRGHGLGGALLVAPPPPRPRPRRNLDLRAYVGPAGHRRARVERAAFVPHVRDDDTIEADEIRARLGDPSLVLFDARAPERWRGDAEPLDPVAGRIPGTRNAFFERAAAGRCNGAARGGDVLRLRRDGGVIAQRLVARRARRCQALPRLVQRMVPRPVQPDRERTRAVTTSVRHSVRSRQAPERRAHRRSRPRGRARDAEGNRLHGRRPREADRRRRHDLDRDDAVQPQPARSRGPREARGSRRGRDPDGVQHDRRLRRRLDGDVAGCARL